MAGKTDIFDEMKSIVGDSYVVHEPEDLIVYEYDGSVDMELPLAVVLPKTAEQVSQVVKVARRHRHGYYISAQHVPV